VSSVGSLPAAVASAVAGRLFAGLTAWIGRGATYLLRQVGVVMSWSTSPQVGTKFFLHEVGVMALLAAGIAVPLLLLCAVQAVIQQDAGVLVRALLVRAPLALVLTGVAVQFVSLGLAATDDMCGAVLRTAGVPVGQLFTRLARVILVATATGTPIPTFAGLVMALAIVAGTLVLWLELALRAAAIQAATLFLPLAMAGVIWPATSHWARRLGETLAALVLAKLVVVAILALAAGDLSGPGSGGIAAIVSGIALLTMAVVAPFALFRLVPMVEAGAVGHLEGLARRPHRAAYSAARRSIDMAAGQHALQVAERETGSEKLSESSGQAGAGEEGSLVRIAGVDPKSVAAVSRNIAPLGRIWNEMQGGGGEDSTGSTGTPDSAPAATSWPPGPAPVTSWPPGMAPGWPGGPTPDAAAGASSGTAQIGVAGRPGARVRSGSPDDGLGDLDAG
jgi:hypothetical protein